ncbi:MAG: dihydrodipicolinate reductase C-terminal domain-containing protein [Bacteroidota bacterium]
MKIALFGYGRMGQEIDRLLANTSNEVIARITEDNANQIDDDQLRIADVVIEFTQPKSALHNYRKCLSLGLPIVSGTTGWLDHWDEWTAEVEAQSGSFFYASNFSLGVNLLFALNEKLAQWMNKQPDYHPELIEIHHTGKRDAPSGTAITIAKGVIQNLDRLDNWQLIEETDVKKPSFNMLPIYSERVDPTPGTHRLTWKSDIDDLEISHVAHSRIGFAKGAIAAAHWLPGKNGVFGMQDLMNL